MTEFKIELETPASSTRSAQLHENLVSAGQALADEDYDTFLLTISAPDGRMLAGCKGEIVFRSAHISELWVDEGHRGIGLGRKLLKFAEQHVRDKDCHRIHLETRSDTARRLYQHLGYSVFGTLPNYDGNRSFYDLEKCID